ncbi:pyrroline-5-carboxylate reductase [Alkalilimnicola ehrlichii MLHE-1]|uniref:Pyrroline-5-carboxylate reductase n=1 Tax=Alkalilimnicola ehrlichii (strain ATCC BAA-1101 / DSM 17681 / MLHE-1) TaxID=187272 RepID=Q0ABU2_ALKEH|nr:pyrroline-5-carboxylate reductase [Alkalilimnicola ehrlichii]ABI55695.1 pyrroline-5-carboxylate reductase [Alkalilimnicola ehrlichii MLHE-1]
MSNNTLCFIGGGNMARSLIGGLLADGFDPQAVRVADPDAGKRDDLANRFGVRVYADNLEAAADADTVILAVKPQVVRTACEQLVAGSGDAGRLFISIAAGVREPDLTRWLGGQAAVVRTMPNTPSLVGTGATALYANDRVKERQRELAESLMRAVGLVVWLDDEAQMDTVTAVSGSGPAYFFLLMEAIEDAARDLGLPGETARLLTIETALGAAKMALESDESPAQLRQRVTSPGGTTEHALHVLEDGEYRALMTRAVQAAAKRAQELGQMLGEQ